MGPVALLVFKTSEPANNGLVGSTPTRLRQPSPRPSPNAQSALRRGLFSLTRSFPYNDGAALDSVTLRSNRGSGTSQRHPQAIGPDIYAGPPLALL